MLLILAADDDDAEGADLHNDSVESLEWLREYELLKQATNKPKDPYELKKANTTLRRHNIGHQEVCELYVVDLFLRLIFCVAVFIELSSLSTTR